MSGSGGGSEDTNHSVVYVISDLHIGGDEQLEEVDFLPELLDFLERLENTSEDAELVINGDAFGLWEFTDVEGIEKFDALTETYPRLFEQFRETGRSVDITLVPGNHDHELVAYPEYKTRLGEYNIDLNETESMTREVGDHTVFFEHGHQRDPNNRIEDWGNPQSTPLGYYLNTRVTSKAGKLSHRGRYNWLKDLQAITPTERIPAWLLSKYFYREMNPALRYALVPFLLLFNVSAVFAVIAGLRLLDIWSQPVNVATNFLSQFGVAGTVIWFFAAINIVVAGLLLLIAVPLHLLRKDIKKTINRFGVLETELTVDPVNNYVEAAEEVFDETDATVYCYGHTHRPSTKNVEGGIMVNSGTWLKRLHRRDGVIGLLPPVFYPSYQLCAVKITPKDSDLAVEFKEIKKSSPGTEELTLTERLLTVGRKPNPTFPETMRVGGERRRNKRSKIE